MAWRAIVVGVNVCGSALALALYALAQSPSSPVGNSSYQPPNEVIIEAQVWQKDHKRIKHLWLADVAGFQRDDLLRQLPRPVLGLASNEFHVFDNGVEQTVNYFRQADSLTADLLSNKWSFVPTIHGTWGAPTLGPHFDFPPASYLIGYALPALRPGECRTVRVVVQGHDLDINRRSYCAPASTEVPDGNETGESTAPTANLSTTGKHSLKWPVSISMQAFTFWSSGVLHFTSKTSQAVSPSEQYSSYDYSYRLEAHDPQRANVHLLVSWSGIGGMDYPCSADHPQLQVVASAYRTNGKVVSQFTAAYSCLTSKWSTLYASPPGGGVDVTSGPPYIIAPERLDSQLELPPGDYTLRVVIRSLQKNFNVLENAQIPLHVAAFDPHRLTTSDMVIGGVIRTAEWLPRDAASVAPAPIIPTPLVSKSLEYFPDSEPQARAGKGTPLYLYFEIYEPQLEAQANAVYYRWRVVDQKTGSTVMSKEPMSAAEWTMPGSTVVPIGLKINVDKLQAGAYRVEMQVSDSSGQKSGWRAAKFNVPHRHSQPITVKNSKLQGTVRSFVVDMQGRSADMICFWNFTSCKKLAPGEYVIVPSPTGKYQNCWNVDLYASAADANKAAPLGTYCLPQQPW